MFFKFSVIFVVFLGIFFALWFLYRNKKVCTLRDRISDLCYNYDSVYCLSSESYAMDSAYDWCYYKTASYGKMIFSFKPLTLEKWLTSEQINKLYKDKIVSF